MPEKPPKDYTDDGTDATPTDDEAAERAKDEPEPEEARGPRRDIRSGAPPDPRR